MENLQEMVLWLEILKIMQAILKGFKFSHSITRWISFQIGRDQFFEYYLGKEAAEKLEKPRVLKSHLPFDLMPYNPKTKYIYVTRNPFDCCVSFYKHHLGIKLYDYDGDFDGYFEMFLRGEVSC